jgi:hypothetical protein
MLLAKMSSLYRPFRHPHSTRVIRLFPEKLESELCAELIEIDLNHAPPYRAISYAWGDDTDLARLWLNGEPVYIRRNLNQCLYRLHQNTATAGFLFWIDALSICQHDLVEKAQQVSILGSHIFPQALEVFAWLGEHADGSEALFPVDISYGYKGRGLLAQDRDTSMTIDRQLQKYALWSAFFERQYWQRLWIV